MDGDSYLLQTRIDDRLFYVTVERQYYSYGNRCEPPPPPGWYAKSKWKGLLQDGSLGESNDYFNMKLGRKKETSQEKFETTKAKIACQSHLQCT